MKLTFWTHDRTDWETIAFDSQLEKTKRKHQLLFFYDQLDIDVFAMSCAVNSTEFLDAHPDRIKCDGIYVSRTWIKYGPALHEIVPFNSIRFDLTEHASQGHNEMYYRHPEGLIRGPAPLNLGQKIDMGRLLGASDFPVRNSRQALDDFGKLRD